MSLKISETGVKLALGDGAEPSEISDKNDAADMQLKVQQLKEEIVARLDQCIRRPDDDSEQR